MKLLMTVDRVGGVWQYATELAEALAPLGVETTVAVMGPAGASDHHPTTVRAERTEKRDRTAIEVIDTHLTLDWLCSSADPVRAAAAALADLARSIGADLVHLNSPALAAATRWPVPVVAVEHGSVAPWWEAAHPGEPLPDGFAWHAAMVRDGLLAADAAVAPSASYAAAVQRRYGLRSAPLAIHNGRTPSALPAAAPASHAFTAGRLWDRVKRTPLLDRVAALTPIHAAGPLTAPHGERVASDHLRHLGTLDAAALAAQLAARPVFVSAASFEPFGLAVLEAAQAGCPLVLSDIPTFRELWDGAALFVDSEEPAEWAAAINQARADRITLGEAARTRAARYTPGATAAAMMGIYRRLLAHRPFASSEVEKGVSGSRVSMSAPGAEARPERLPWQAVEGLDTERGGRAPAAREPRRMRIAYLTHSLASCWNHGNAHFLRGVLRELIARGHDVRALEPAGNWSLANLLADAGDAGLDAYRAAYPELSSTSFAPDMPVDELVGDAELVIVHEWNEPALVAAIGALRKAGGRFTLLFHDTHHRAVSDPDAIRAFDLSGYDGVLAFGETLSEVYRRWGWGDRVWTWHEAADTRLFHPPEGETDRAGLVWIGNWGDGERTAELENFLFAAARDVGLPLDIYGVRYPDDARATLARYGARYHGWAPNARAPGIFAEHMATVHVPRRYYTTILPGIPTIRVFEALACGIPLVSAPWSDAEGLFRVGEDFLMVSDGAAMAQALARLHDDPAERAALSASGLETIRARHTCAHRVDELMGIVTGLSTTNTRHPVRAELVEAQAASERLGARPSTSSGRTEDRLADVPRKIA